MQTNRLPRLIPDIKQLNSIIKTDNINICKRVEHDVYGLCKDVAIGKDSCLPNNADYTPLSGHHRFGAGKTKRICCKSNKKDIQIGLVWVN